MMEKLKKRLQDGHAVDEKGYFESYRGNIFRGRMSIEFQDMFNAGSGDELRTKAEAVHSSSMLSYNFFHWIDVKHPFMWKGVKYTKVLFEVKMKTIQKSNAPANMDVVLISKDKKHLLFIESKFLEYTVKEAFSLSKGYEDENRWYNHAVDWIMLVKSVPKEDCKYMGGIKQLITHLFGIYGLMCKDGETIDYATKHCKALKDITDLAAAKKEFVTVVFNPQERYDESKDYKDYERLFGKFRDVIKDVKGLERVQPQWLTYSDMWKEMKEQIKPKELRAFLWERYMRFAEGTEE
ncbi:MAG: hypothetical protein IKR89_06795 [Bacteroidaceae bacterium]|nr:hypothetical protein [Bacteroidaceae bacterium]